ncbi:M20/M25/M40 family metallo-hydrolase [Bartonella ancashensis]|uniref:Catalyzes the cleavage of p-aminobenzoyl-glutamate to p-aminobenzoate and glutamate, subunit A n=1 Tax=Bartonella ancashensis TaxID=1318743 RepID=A0A0M3T2W7_9HYPH|nr:M20/M25/M40 family metallo-hydrolase [Bartonella ancashensis]ALE03455.1 Catalyzes the cleavage of p-aminobenzoyl-glutamate to p-aminobenzoate and glutamate, subunit A [Bartonella ancashensis]
MLNKVLTHIDENMEESLERLFSLLRFQSISTDPVYKDACRKTADWLVADLKSMGFESSRHDTSGHPIVVGHHPGPSDDCLHVLFYGHYDVQPVDPLNLWKSAPFEPYLEEQNGEKVICARGASDDKGQLMTFVEACRAFKKEAGQLPVKVTVLFEGEEESGSSSLCPFLKEHIDELKADCALVCDTSMWDVNTPSISVSLRGLLGEEVVITAANCDLHSGYFGGAAANPIHILTRILAGLHDDDGKVTLPGFYDGVEETPLPILQSWSELDCDAENFLGPVGLFIPSGEKGRSILEQVWVRPTAEVNGISGGYEGEGFKTVIASQASAKVSFRLVHKQNPEKIREIFRDYVRRFIPADCTVEFKEHGASPAIQLPYDSPFIEATKDALSQEWSHPAVLIAMGGSIPVVGDFRSILDMETILVGFALADDRIHSPNEKYNLKSFHKGQRSWARILTILADRRINDRDSCSSR